MLLKALSSAAAFSPSSPGVHLALGGRPTSTSRPVLAERTLLSGQSRTAVKKRDEWKRNAPPRLVTTEEWVAEESSELPDLPRDALIIEEEDEGIWNDEKTEFNGLLSDSRTPASLLAYLQSFKLPTGVFCHAFDGKGTPLSQFQWTKLGQDEAMSDSVRTKLITGLLDAVDLLHTRGSAHLGLDASSVRIVPVSDKDLELRIVGLGAAVRLSSPSGRKSYQLDSSIGFEAPELLSSAMVTSNLRAIFKIDAWAVGVLIAMIAGSMNSSPFFAIPNWKKGLFSEEGATYERIKTVQSELGSFLTQIDADSSGYLFRHGWVIKLIIGLLQQDPAQRLTVHDAWETARSATAAAATTAISSEPVTAADTPEATEQSVDKKSDVSVATVAPTETTDQVDVEEDVAVESLERDFLKGLTSGNTASSEPFRSLEAMMNILDRGDVYVTMEGYPRNRTIKNYGRVIGYRNRADRQRWDCFVPGVKKPLPKNKFLKVRDVLGVVLIRGGNHKLVIDVNRRNATKDEDLIKGDIKNFLNVYQEAHPDIPAKRIKYLSLGDITF